MQVNLSMNFAELARFYDALFLDNDGTCGRTEELHAEIGCEILRDNGVPDMTYEERFSMTGFGEYGIWEFLNKQGRTPSISPAEFARLQSQRFTERIAAIDNPAKIVRPGIPELALAFRDAGKPVIVVSNTPRDAVVAVQTAAGLNGLTDGLITFTEIHDLGLRKKPEDDPYLLAKALVRNGIRPDDVARMSQVEKDQLVLKLVPAERARNDMYALAVEDSKTGATSAMKAACHVLEIVYTKLNQVHHHGSTFGVTDEEHVESARVLRQDHIMELTAR